MFRLSLELLSVLFPPKLCRSSLKQARKNHIIFIIYFIYNSLFLAHHTVCSENAQYFNILSHSIYYAFPQNSYKLFFLRLKRQDHVFCQKFNWKSSSKKIIRRYLLCKQCTNDYCTFLHVSHPITGQPGSQMSIPEHIVVLGLYNRKAVYGSLDGKIPSLPLVTKNLPRNVMETKEMHN